MSTTGMRDAAPPVTTLSARLRAETRAAHEHVEHAAAFNRLIVVRIPADDDAMPAAERTRLARARAEYREVYATFLRATFGFEAAALAAIEEPATAALLAASGYPSEPRRATDLLRDDAARVFGEPAAAGLHAMDGLPPARTLPRLAGLEYVRRGSRLGGTVIASVVGPTLGLGAADGMSFLGQYGKGTRAAFDGVRAWLDALPFAPAEADEAVASALDTFEAIGRWHLRVEAGGRG